MNTEAKEFYTKFLDVNTALLAAVWELSAACEKGEITLEQLKADTVTELEKVKEVI